MAFVQIVAKALIEIAALALLVTPRIVLDQHIPVAWKLWLEAMASIAIVLGRKRRAALTVRLVPARDDASPSWPERRSVAH